MRTITCALAVLTLLALLGGCAHPGEVQGGDARHVAFTKMPGGKTLATVTYQDHLLGAPVITVAYETTGNPDDPRTPWHLVTAAGGQDPRVVFGSALVGGVAAGATTGVGGALVSRAVSGSSSTSGSGNITNIDTVTVGGATATISH